MVSVKLIGGLGNQMFQIAACIAYAKRHSLEYHIPLTTQNSHQAEPYFKTLWNENWDAGKEAIQYHELAFHYNEIPLINYNPEKQNIILNGYFQSYKYFEGFNFGKLFYRSLTNGRAGEGMYDRKIDSLAIHIRKGDYELYPTKHPVVSVDYISAALELFKQKGIEKVTFFSDSPEWCGQFAHLRKISCSVVFEYNPIKCFLKLMPYDNFILSNSTFGYWAAVMHTWLNGEKNGETVYPAEWFGTDYAHMDTKDLCPPDWIKM